MHKQAYVIYLVFALALGAAPTRARAETDARELAADAAPLCAILSFDVPEGVTPGQARLVTDRFAVELSRTGGYRIMPRDKMREILELQKFSRSEHCTATDCAIEVGRLLAAKFMFYGSIGRVGDLHSLNAYLVNVEKGAVERVATADVRGGMDRVLSEGAVQLAAQFAPENLAEAGSEPSEEEAPADCNTVVISKPREGTLRLHYRGNDATYRLTKPAKLYLSRGRYPFTLVVPGHDTIYGVFNIDVVTEETRLFRLGNVEKLELFPAEKLEGVWRGSPVSGQVQLSLPTGMIRPLSYVLSLNRIQ